MELHNLKPANGSIKASKRAVGRGEGSKKGGTATRGHNGAKSRSGYSKKIGFEVNLSDQSTAPVFQLYGCPKEFKPSKVTAPNV